MDRNDVPPESRHLHNDDSFSYEPISKRGKVTIAVLVIGIVLACLFYSLRRGDLVGPTLGVTAIFLVGSHLYAALS